jgi:hypothetical protein
MVGTYPDITTFTYSLQPSRTIVSAINLGETYSIWLDLLTYCNSCKNGNISYQYWRDSFRYDEFTYALQFLKMAVSAINLREAYLDTVGFTYKL